VNLDKKSAWKEYRRRLYDTGITLLAEADKTTVGAKPSDPKVLAMALLTRTLSNFNGSFLMIDAGMIVEARTLTRCCFENLLWLAELAAKREAFVEEMVRDQVSSQQTRGKMVLSWGDKIEDAASYEERLRQQLATLSEKYPKAKSIKFAELGKTNGIDNTYIWFRVLSADAAHPSLESLSRYFSYTPQREMLLSFIPEPKKNEAEMTMQLASQALLGVCVATCEIVSVPKTHATLLPLFDEFLALAK
jgi:hypothetical protein